MKGIDERKVLYEKQFRIRRGIGTLATSIDLFGPCENQTRSTTTY